MRPSRKTRWRRSLGTAVLACSALLTITAGAQDRASLPRFPEPVPPTPEAVPPIETPGQHFADRPIAPGTPVVGIISDSLARDPWLEREPHRHARIVTGLPDQQDGTLPARIISLRDDRAVFGETATDEGRLIAGRIHEAAADASVVFHAATGGAPGIANAMDALCAPTPRGMSADLVVINVADPRAPAYTPGPATRAVHRCARAGVAVVASAGNASRGARMLPAATPPAESTITLTLPPNAGTYVTYDWSAYHGHVAWSWSEQADIEHYRVPALDAAPGYTRWIHNTADVPREIRVDLVHALVDGTLRLDVTHHSVVLEGAGRPVTPIKGYRAHPGVISVGACDRNGIPRRSSAHSADSDLPTLWVRDHSEDDAFRGTSAAAASAAARLASKLADKAGAPPKTSQLADCSG